MNENSDAAAKKSNVQKIIEIVRQDPEFVFTDILSFIDMKILKDAFLWARNQKLPDILGFAARDFESNPAENLRLLYDRLTSGRYNPPPQTKKSEKEPKLAAAHARLQFEDLILQRTVFILLKAAFDKDFYTISFSLQEQGQLKAMQKVSHHCLKEKIEWIVPLKVSGLVRGRNQDQVLTLLQKRVDENELIKLLRKWLTAFEDTLPASGELTVSDNDLIATMMINLHMHHVLDHWYVKTAHRSIRGKKFLIRHGHEFVFGCEFEEDARKWIKMLANPFERTSLELMPKNIAIVPFKRPTPQQQSAKPAGTFIFLDHKHAWQKSNQKRWQLKREKFQKGFLGKLKSMFS